jgi:hypothetical protein
MTKRWMRTAAGWAAATALAACGGGAPPANGEPESPAAASACAIVRRDVLLDRAMRETSGAAIDPRDPEVVWTQNDSGNEPEVFAFGADGRILARLEVAGAANHDWEDLAVGPCPGGTCMYLFDTGDSDRGRRDPAVLYRLPLPSPADSGRTAPAERFEARYPDGHRDAEAGIVLPDGSIYLVNKGNREAVELWRWPAPLGEGAELERVRTLAPEPGQPGDRVTGAAASPDGRWVAVRTYGRLALYRTAELLGAGGPAFTMDLTALGEPQGEGVALRDDGTVVLTSESGTGAFPPRATWLRCSLE